MNGPQRYEQWAAELDELAAVPAEVLADWVIAPELSPRAAEGVLIRS